MRALITGGTGFIGRHLAAKLDQPIILTRDPDKAKALYGTKTIPGLWPPVPQVLNDVDVVFNLVGESVGEGRWTKRKKARILESRIDGTRRLVEAIRGNPKRPQVLVSASAVGFYGDRGDEILSETSSPGSDFLAEVCQKWEAEARKAEELGVRVVICRFGVVLGVDGGAMPKMMTPIRWFVGGRLGGGHQWMPWIHIEDLVGILLIAAEKSRGVMNAASPNPVTNREFTRILARTMGRPAMFPAPWFALRLMLGEFANVLFGGQRVRPDAAAQAGYTFRHPDLEEALKDLIKP